MSFESQDRAIENLLRSKYGEWLPCYELADLALQYCRAINTIRKRLRRAGDRERIENKKERVRGQVHGFYRIAPTADFLGIAPAKPVPIKSWEQIVKERDEKMRQPEPSFELVP